MDVFGNATTQIRRIFQKEGGGGIIYKFFILSSTFCYKRIFLYELTLNIGRKPYLAINPIEHLYPVKQIVFQTRLLNILREKKFCKKNIATVLLFNLDSYLLLKIISGYICNHTLYCGNTIYRY